MMAISYVFAMSDTVFAMWPYSAIKEDWRAEAAMWYVLVSSNTVPGAWTVSNMDGSSARCRMREHGRRLGASGEGLGAISDGVPSGELTA